QVHKPDADGSPQLPISTMKSMLRLSCGVASAIALSLAILGARSSSSISETSLQQPPPSPQQPPPSQPPEISTSIRIDAGAAPPRLAVPDFLAGSSDSESTAVAKTIAEVLWDDLNFEREFSMIPRDTYASIPRATSLSDVPFDRWRELGADGLVIGVVQKV